MMKPCIPLAEAGVTNRETLDATAYFFICVNCPLSICIEDLPTKGAYKMLDDIDPSRLGFEPMKATRWH